MKTHILVSVMIGLLYWSANAQTADQLVNQGLSDLSVQDLYDANTNFMHAQAISSTNENANALYAITRLLVLPNQPAGSNFLTLIGIPASGRNIYHWTAKVPEDTNGVPLAPNGVDGNAFTAQLRTNVLNAVIGSVSNLSAITDTNFTISLTSSETSISAVTVDYGDLKLIQAGLYGAEYFIYTLNAQNLGVQLTALRALYTNGILSAGRVLADYPQLLTFTNENDLQAARVAFTNAVNAYMIASEFIRTRPADEVRLFNFDQVSGQNEADFRLTLQDLENSLLVGPQWLAVNPNLAVDLSAQFDDPASWRSLLPNLDGNAIELGSFPDVSFGGVIYGLGEDEVEGFWGKYLVMLPVGRAPSLLSSNAVAITFTTLNGHYYVLEASTNLLAWQIVAYFTATNASTSLVDLQGVRLSKRFYRLRDDTGFFVFAGVVLDENTGLPIAGAKVQSLYDGSVTYTDANGQFFLGTSVPTSWYEDELEISASGYNPVYNYYYGNGFVPGLQIYLSPPPPNDYFANRTPLTGSNVSANGNNSGATWESGEPYDLYYYNGYGDKSVWFSWTPPTTGSYVISISTTSVYYPILAIYTGSLLSSLTRVTDIVGNDYYAGYTLNASAGQTYQIEIDDYYGYGGPYTLSVAP